MKTCYFTAASHLLLHNLNRTTRPFFMQSAVLCPTLGFPCTSFASLFSQASSIYPGAIVALTIQKNSISIMLGIPTAHFDSWELFTLHLSALQQLPLSFHTILLGLWLVTPLLKTKPNQCYCNNTCLKVMKNVITVALISTY